MCSRFAQFQRQTRILFLSLFFASFSLRACRFPLSYAYLCLGQRADQNASMQRNSLVVVVVVVVTAGQERKQRATTQRNDLHIKING